MPEKKLGVSLISVERGKLDKGGSATVLLQTGNKKLLRILCLPLSKYSVEQSTAAEEGSEKRHVYTYKHAHTQTSKQQQQAAPDTHT